MYIWLVIFGSLIILLIVFSFIYISTNIRKIPFFDKIKNKIIKVIVSFIPLLIVFLLFNIINSIVILIHLFLFTLLIQLTFYIIKKINKNISIKDYYKILFSIVITVIYLSIGAYLNYHVFETKYEIETNKNIGTDRFIIIQISDSHVGATFNGDGFKKHIEKISKIESDIVVITGDFVDDNTTKEDMIKSCEALSILKPKYGIYFIYGNHDRGYFNSRDYNEQDIENELSKNNVIVLKDEVIEINDYIYLIGRDDNSNLDRKSIEDLTSSLDKEKYIIDLNHQPNDYENEKNNVDLVLSGHTHGGQLFPLEYIGLLIGANDNEYGLKKIGNTNFIVNSGISDWEIDFKTGTYSEYGIIDILKK